MADQPRKIIGARIQRHVPALAQSVMCAHERMVMDAALMRGRACRVGWGPGMTLVHAGNPVLEEEKMKRECSVTVNCCTLVISIAKTLETPQSCLKPLMY